jgi:hypothetical protein
MQPTFRTPGFSAARLQRHSEAEESSTINPKALVTYNPGHKVVAKDLLERLIPDLSELGYFVRTVELSNADDATIVLNNTTYLNFNEIKRVIRSAPRVPQAQTLSRRSP